MVYRNEMIDDVITMYNLLLGCQEQLTKFLK